MKIRKTAIAGTLESSDILVSIEPGKGGIHIELQSIVEKQFGNAIREEITQTLEKLNVNSAQLTVVDKGALDCTIRARVETAVYRASEISLDCGGEEN